MVGELPQGVYMINGIRSDTVFEGSDTSAGWANYLNGKGSLSTRTAGELQGLGFKYDPRMNGGKGGWEKGSGDQEIASYRLKEG